MSETPVLPQINVFLKPSVSSEKMGEYQISANGTTAFFGKKSALSNFYPSPFSVDGINFYETVEQYYQSEKARICGDQFLMEKIRTEADPRMNKEDGRKVNLKEEWFDARMDVMKTGLMHKFEQNEFCRLLLRTTGEQTLVEASKHDFYWGSGSSLYDHSTFNYAYGGKNHLGKLLEQVRESLNQKNSATF